VPINRILGSLGFERAVVDRAVLKPLETFELPVASAADLVVMKAVAHRALETADIDAILRTFSELDVRAICTTVEGFARLLETPEVLEEFDHVVQRLRRRQH